MTQPLPPKSKRGFGSMNPARQREIARMGGAAVAADRRSFSQNRELAVSAGRKGGQQLRRKAGCKGSTQPGEVVHEPQ